jgi:RNA polymerase sigma-70 factor, ECF subfamily
MEQVSDLSLFNELFTIYKGRFVRFAQTFTRDATIAEDIVIDSLIYYWEHRTELNKESNIPAYVLTVIKHKCLNYLQHKTVIRIVLIVSADMRPNLSALFFSIERNVFS